MPAVALFSFSHLLAVSPLVPDTLEGGLPKGPGASTYLPLKKARVALGERREAGHSPGLLLRFLLLPVEGDSREQDGALTENRKQNQTGASSTQASPEACQPAHCEPWGFSHKEGGRKPASRLGAATQPSRGQALRLGRSRSSPGCLSILTASLLLGLLFAVCFPPCYVPRLDLQREFP